ncbi:DNA-3-methyladenine glycosylase 2 family protein, partial [Streptomyces sp. SID7909]|nr:DNA-3-methyladenine glycosylase 2 family protein [Streptomyces sp. SID7909]
DAGADRDEAEQALRRLPGIGPATAALIRMRGLGDPDVDPYGTPGTSGWRPWRSYGVRRARSFGQPQISAPSQAPVTSRHAKSSTSTE